MKNSVCYPTRRGRSNWDMFFGYPMMESNVNTMMPSVNVKETDEAYEIELAAPGFERNDFNVEVEKNILAISAKKADQATEENSKYTRREFKTRSFKRTFQLPNHVNAEEVQAKYNNGILSVWLPKNEQVRSRVIEIA